MSKVKINKERCKACGICTRECPKQAIALSAELNAKGYNIVQIDDEKCIKCGICYYMCPDCVFELEV